MMNMSTTSSDPISNAGIDSIVNATRFNTIFTDDVNDPTAIPVDVIATDNWSSYVSSQDTQTQTWLQAFNSPPTSAVPIPNSSTHSLSYYALAVATSTNEPNPLTRLATALSHLPTSSKTYIIRSYPADLNEMLFELAWGLLTYNFTLYKSADKCLPVLVRLTQLDTEDRLQVDRTLTATYMARDMINTTAENFGPAQLEAASSTLATFHSAKFTSIVSEQLLTLGYPQVHRVGRGATTERSPRLLEIIWNNSNNNNDTQLPQVTLIGKGVCYDTGGLSLKPSSSMINMKKDMAGAAQVLGLAHMIMDAKLNVRLRILIPAVENSVSSNSYRPGDILTCRNGMTTLNVNSDAEGRLILADALVAATEENPDLIIDCATLTGAQRVAMGPDIPSFFCTDDEVSAKLFDISKKVHDLVWPLPLYEPYRKLLDTPIADIKSCGSGSHGGCITAALYLKEFVGDSLWIHLDFMGYNNCSSPGRPEGGEAMGMRSLFELIRQRYSP